MVQNELIGETDLPNEDSRNREDGTMGVEFKFFNSLHNRHQYISWLAQRQMQGAMLF